MKAIVPGIALLLACSTAQAQTTYTWTDITPGGSTAYVSGIVVHPLDAGRIIARGVFGDAGATKSVAFSDNAGATWISPSVAPSAASALFVHPGMPGVVYLTRAGNLPDSRYNVAANDGRLYRSDNFGRTWALVNTTAVDTRSFRVDSIYPVGSDPMDVHHLYAIRAQAIGCGYAYPFCTVTTNTGIVESRDDGSSWGDTGLALEPYSLVGYSMPTPPTPSNPTRLYITGPRQQVLESRDSAATWRILDVPLRWIGLDPIRPHVMYGHRFYYDSVFSHWLLLRTDDGGVTWRHVFDSQWGFEPPTIDPARSRVLWISEGDFLSRSEDSGDTWQKVSYPTVQQPFPGHGRIVVSPTEPGVVYLTYGNRLFRGVPSVLPNPVVVEFQYEGDRYWLTSLDGEAVSQDYRMEPSHVRRTGVRWGVWRAHTALPGAVGSCRFWTRPESGLRTRVLVLRGFECDLLKANPNFLLEGEDEFFAMLPNAAGVCASGLVPVRRFNNMKADLNHRWVADGGIADQMRVQGWYDEGVRMCARPLGTGTNE